MSDQRDKSWMPIKGGYLQITGLADCLMFLAETADPLGTDAVKWIQNKAGYMVMGYGFQIIQESFWNNETQSYFTRWKCSTTCD